MKISKILFRFFNILTGFVIVLGSINAQSSYLSKSDFSTNVYKHYAVKKSNNLDHQEITLKKINQLLSSERVLNKEIVQSLKSYEKATLPLNKKAENDFVVLEEIFEFYLSDIPMINRYSFIYDQNWNKIEELDETWENNMWNNHSLLTFSFDNLPVPSEELFKLWENNTWFNKQKSVFTYDPNLNLIEMQRYELQSGGWKSISRWYYTYDDNSNELEWRWENWDGEKWVGFIKTVSTYDDSGNIVSFKWSWGNGIGYTNSSMSEYVYDSNNRLVQEKYKYWDLGEWIDEATDSYTYHEDGRIERLHQSIWDSDSKEIRTFNEFNDIISSITSVLQEDGVSWTEVYRENYTYDENRNNTETVSENFWNGSSWEMVSRTKRTYQQMVTDVRLTNGEVPNRFELNQNYPNPFNPSTTINYSIPSEGHVQLTIYDVLGNEVQVLENTYKSAGNYSFQLDAAELTSGIYFYTLVSGDFIETKKMILLK